MEETLQLQIDMTRNLLSALDNLVNRLEAVSGSINDQASITANALNSFAEAEQNMNNLGSSSEQFVRQINSAASQNSVARSVETRANAVSRELQEGISSANRTARRNINDVNSSNAHLERARRSTANTSRTLARSDQLPEAMGEAARSLELIESSITKTEATAGIMSKIISGLAEIKDGFVTGGLSLVGTALKGLLAFVKTALSAFTTLVGSMAKMFAFSVSLPFTIARIAVDIGNKIRSDVVEVIQGAGEEAKNAFDLSSEIGKNANKMTQTAKGLMKTFQSPRTRLARLFGMGASGAASFLRETFKAVEDMGHYSEIFGPSILGNTKSGQYLIEMQKAMGLGASEMAYYALEAFNSGKHPIDTLHETSQIIKRVADENDLDFKAMTKDFHTLRTNIMEFGHLSSNEIGNLVGKLRKMKVKTEDAVNVFKKFTSFEEAAKASAMLFQTFEMNIDAFNLLTSRDPGEMLQQFRDAMFATGKNFKDLNRHEKALMSSITGISEHGLSTLMNYMDLGLTQDEARKRMEEEDPTKEQTKMIKGLTSTIKQFQKTIQFSSPFQAFFQGLLENKMNQKDLQNSLVSLSEIYSDIRHIGFTLNLSELESILAPITEILRRVDQLVNGNKFKEIMTLTTTTASEFLDEVSYDLQSPAGKELTKIRYKIESAKKLSAENNDKSYETLNSRFKLYLSETINIDSLDKNIIESLKDSGIIEEKRKGFKSFKKGLTSEKFMNSIISLDGQFKGDKKLDVAVKELISKTKEAYEFGFNNVTGSTKEAVRKEAEKRTSIKGRVDNLYDNLVKMFDEGMPHFSHFVDMGGNIMGSIIRGLLKGITAGFHLMAGASKKAVDALGINVTDKIKEEAEASGMNANDFTLLNHLGITEVEASQISTGLGKEIGGVVSRLPSMMSMAGSLIADLAACLADFAKGILGFAADMTLEAYNQQGFFVRQYMRRQGFNPSKAQAAVSASKFNSKDKTSRSKIKKDNTFGFVGHSFLEEAQEEEDFGYASTSSRILGSAIAHIEQMKSLLHPDTVGFAFLNSPQIKSYIEYIKERKNWTKDRVLGVHDDDDAGERMQALFQIAKTAGELNNKNIPSSIFENNKESKKLEKYLKSINYNNKKLASNAIKNFGIESKESMHSKVSSFTDTGAWLGESNPQIIRDFKKDMETIGFNNFVRQQALQEKISKSSVEDVIYSGKNAVLYTPKQSFVLHDSDTVLAAKEGGFLNNLFIELTDSVNEKNSNIINFYREELVKTKAVVSQYDSTNINVADIDVDASGEDIEKIFSTYEEIIHIIIDKDFDNINSNIMIES